MNVHLNSPIEIKFASFYFTLKSKIAKRTNISFEKLQSHEGNLYFPAYCSFISLNSRAIEHIKKQKQYLSLIENIEQNTININIDNLKGLDYIKKKIIYEDNLKFSIIDSDSTYTLKNYFVSHPPKNDYVIFFLKILNTDNQQISKNYILKQQIIEEFKIKEKSGKYAAKFKGLFIIDNNEKQEILIFDKTSLLWYSIPNSKWISNLTFPNNLKKVFLVYFIKPLKINSIFSFYSQPDLVVPLSTNSKRLIYLETFTNIFKINPSLIIKNKEFYYKWLNLEQSQYFKEMLDLLVNKGYLNSNKLGCEVIMHLLKQRKNLIDIIKKNSEMKIVVKRY